MRSLSFISCCFFMTACSSEPFIQNKTLDSSNSAKVIVYTPDTAFNQQNFIKPTIYMDGLKLGKVAIDTPLSAFLPAGIHTISFQRSFPLMPITEAGNIEIDMKQTETYYIRYSYDFDDHVQTNSEPRATGASSFRWVGKSKGENKE